MKSDETSQEKENRPFQPAADRNKPWKPKLIDKMLLTASGQGSFRAGDKAALIAAKEAAERAAEEAVEEAMRASNAALAARAAAEEAVKEATKEASKAALAAETAKQAAKEVKAAKISLAAMDAAERAAAKAAEEAAEQAAKEAAEREAKLAAERAASEMAEREAAEEAARKAAEKAAEQAAREAAEREAREMAERAAVEAAQREARERAEAARIAEADRAARTARAIKAAKAAKAKKAVVAQKASKAAMTARAAKFAKRAAEKQQTTRKRHVKRELNWKLAVAMSVTAATLVVGIYLVHGFQMKRTAGLMLRQAKAAQEKGQLDEAVQFYTYYVNYAPEDDEAYCTLAMLVTDQSEKRPNRRAFMRAFLMLEQAARRDPENVDVLFRLVDYSMEIGRMSDAAEHLKRLRTKFPGDSELEVKLGRCQMATEHFREAIASFQGVVASDPRNGEAYIELARLLRDKAGDPDQADAVVNQMVTANGTSAKARLLRGQYRQENDDLAGAKEDVLRALEMAPDNAEVLVAAAQLAMDEQELEDARGYLDRARELYPDDEKVHQALAVLNVTEGKTDEAIDLFHEAVDKSEDPRAMLSLADLQLKKGDVAAVRHTIKQMRKAGYRPEILEYFESRIHIAESRWREASYMLERLRPKVAGNPEFANRVDLLLGLSYEQLRLFDRQLDVYHRVLNEDPSLIPARLGYASALFRTGKLDQAAEEYKKLEGTMGTDEFLKVPALRNNMFQLTVARIERLPEAEQNWTELEEFLEKVESAQDVDEVQATLMRAELLAKTDKLEKARELVSARRDEKPKELDLWIAQAKLAAMGKGPEAGLKVLDDAFTQLGDSLALRLTRANMAIRLDPIQGKRILRMLESEVEKFSKTEQARLWRGLGAAYYRFRDREKARQFWQRVVELQPGDAQMLLTLFELARETGDEAGISKAAEAVKKLLGRRSSEFYYCEASRAIWMVQAGTSDKKTLGPAKQLLRIAAQQRPNWHEIPRLEAEIALLENSMDTAIEKFQLASELGPLSPVYLGQLVRLLYINGRYEEAKEVIGKLQGREVSLTMRKLEAELSFLTGDLNQALDLAKKTVVNSQQATDFLWYGQLLARGQKNEEAQASFRRALELDSTIPQAWLALVALLVDAKKPAEAQKVVLEAEVKLSEDVAPLTLAQAYQMLGDATRAEQYFLRALSLIPGDIRVIRKVAQFYLQTGNREKAHKYLGQILKLAGSDPEKYQDQLVWARRSLARVLASERHYGRLLQGLKLLEQNVRDGKMSVEDVRLKAAMLASRSDRKSRQEAVSLYEEIRKRQDGTLSPREQFALAQLYDKTDRWTRCRDEMLNLVTEHPEHVGFLVGYIHTLLRHDSPSGAVKPWVDKLEKLRPKAPATIAIKARMLVKARKPESAVRLLETLIPRPLPSRQVDKLREVANLMEELELFDEAEKLLVEFAQKTPEGPLALASFLGKRKKVDHALDQCELAIENAVPVAGVLATAVGILRESRDVVTPEHFTRVNKWFANAVERNPHSKEILLQLGGFRDLQGKYTEVIKIYRDFLKRSDVTDFEKALASNNLAFVLAIGTDQGEESFKMVNTAIDVLGPSPDLLDTRAMAYLATGRPKSAIEDLRQAIADSPSALKYFHLALAHKAANDKRSAARAMQVARDNHFLNLQQVPKVERDKYKELVDSL